MSCDAPPCQAQVNFRSGHAVQERVDLVKDKCWKSQVPFDHALVWHSPSSQGPHVSCKGASASAAASHWIGSIGSCFFFCSIKSSSVKLCSSYIYYIYILLLCLLCLFASLSLSLSLWFGDALKVLQGRSLSGCWINLPDLSGLETAETGNCARECWNIRDNDSERVQKTDIIFLRVQNDAEKVRRR